MQILVNPKIGGLYKFIPCCYTRLRKGPNSFGNEFIKGDEVVITEFNEGEILFVVLLDCCEVDKRTYAKILFQDKIGWMHIVDNELILTEDTDDCR